MMSLMIVSALGSEPDPKSFRVSKSLSIDLNMLRIKPPYTQFCSIHPLTEWGHGALRDTPRDTPRSGHTPLSARLGTDTY